MGYTLRIGELEIKYHQDEDEPRIDVAAKGFHELPVDQGSCSECDDDLHDDKDNWQAAQEGRK